MVQISIADKEAYSFFNSLIFNDCVSYRKSSEWVSLSQIGYVKESWKSNKKLGTAAQWNNALASYNIFV